jgi:preprotein translocase subunit SecF
MRFFSHASYHFIEKRRTAYVFSAIAILVGIGAMVFNVISIGNWQNYGVDFTGGSLVQVHFQDDVTVQDVRSALGGISGPEVTRFSGENEFVIRAQLSEENIDLVRAGIEDQLTQAFGPTYEVSRTELVGPKIGSELQSKAALAILFSFILTLIYLAIRFELRFGMAAVIATVHDILITLGFLAVFRVEIMLGAHLGDDPGGSDGAPGPRACGHPGLLPGVDPGGGDRNVLIDLRGLTGPPGD